MKEGGKTPGSYIESLHHGLWEFLLYTEYSGMIVLCDMHETLNDLISECDVRQVIELQCSVEQLFIFLLLLLLRQSNNLAVPACAVSVLYLSAHTHLRLGDWHSGTL